MRRLLWIPWRWWRRAAQLRATGGFRLAVPPHGVFRRRTVARRREYSVPARPAGRGRRHARRPPGDCAVLARAGDGRADARPGTVLLRLGLPAGNALGLLSSLAAPITRRTNALLRPRLAAAAAAPLRGTRYFLLIAVLLAAGLAFPLVGLVDPFSLLVRGLTFAL